MKPQFIITSISEKECYWRPGRVVNFNRIPSSLAFNLEISVEGNGSFDDYIEEGVLNKDKIAMDILHGKISIVGLDNIGK